jgi:hypothetical protein
VLKVIKSTSKILVGRAAYICIQNIIVLNPKRKSSGSRWENDARYELKKSLCLINCALCHEDVWEVVV